MNQVSFGEVTVGGPGATRIWHGRQLRLARPQHLVLRHDRALAGQKDGGRWVDSTIPTQLNRALEYDMNLRWRTVHVTTMAVLSGEQEAVPLASESYTYMPH